MRDSVRVTIDEPATYRKGQQTIVCFFALPNGNTTEHTMGKTLKEGDDWHFDIQHIAAQTTFIRNTMQDKNFVVIYLESPYKSWPAWKQRNPHFRVSIPVIIDSVTRLIPAKNKVIYLNGHSGGGSFIFGYLASIDNIPSKVKRISFLDSNYGYDSTYYPKFHHWLRDVKGSTLNVFAYNDSVALYNGKPIVSATGGTWYRSRMMLNDLGRDFKFTNTRSDSLIIDKGLDERIQFFLRTNPDRKIFHTVQVELNGFIHSILAGTPYDSRKYSYLQSRAYSEYIK